MREGVRNNGLTMTLNLFYDFLHFSHLSSSSSTSPLVPAPKFPQSRLLLGWSEKQFWLEVGRWISLKRLKVREEKTKKKRGREIMSGEIDQG